MSDIKLSGISSDQLNEYRKSLESPTQASPAFARLCGDLHIETHSRKAVHLVEQLRSLGWNMDAVNFQSPGEKLGSLHAKESGRAHAAFGGAASGSTVAKGRAAIEAKLNQKPTGYYEDVGPGPRNSAFHDLATGAPIENPPMVIDESQPNASPFGILADDPDLSPHRSASPRTGSVAVRADGSVIDNTGVLPDAKGPGLTNPYFDVEYDRGHHVPYEDDISKHELPHSLPLESKDLSRKVGSLDPAKVPALRVKLESGALTKEEQIDLCRLIKGRLSKAISEGSFISSVNPDDYSRYDAFRTLSKKLEDGALSEEEQTELSSLLAKYIGN